MHSRTLEKGIRTWWTHDELFNATVVILEGCVATAVAPLSERLTSHSWPPNVVLVLKALILDDNWRATFLNANALRTVGTSTS